MRVTAAMSSAVVGRSNLTRPAIPHMGSHPVLQSRHASQINARVFIPIDRGPQAFFQRPSRSKAKKLFSLCGIQTTTRLSVQFIGIPYERAVEAREAGNEVCKIHDGN